MNSILGNITILILLFVQFGKTTADPKHKLRDVAKSFQRQYVRIALEDTVDFYLAEIKSPLYYLCSSIDWEGEMFRQLRQLFISLQRDDRMEEEEEETNHTASQPNLSENQQTVISDLMKKDGREGQTFNFPRNLSRTEVRTGKDKDGNYLYDQFFDLLDGICRKDNPVYPLFTAKIAGNKNHSPKTNTQDLKEQIIAEFERMKREMYERNGYATNGTVEGGDGGGNLPLDAKTTLELAIFIFDSIPRAYFENPLMMFDWLWWGGGWGEEPKFIAHLAKKFGFPVHITCLDISSVCCESFQKEVERLDLQDFITVCEGNLYSAPILPKNDDGDVANTHPEYDVIYTSAAIESIFTLKMLFLSLTCKSIQYMLCNHTHCLHLHEEGGDMKQWSKTRKVAVKGKLDQDRNNTKEDRWIYALDVSRFAST